MISGTDKIVKDVTEGFAADVKRILGDEPQGALSYEQQLEMMAHLNTWKARAERAEAEFETQRAIVARVWERLGSPTYASLNGRSIYDLVDEGVAARQEAASLRQDLAAATEWTERLKLEVERGAWQLEQMDTTWRKDVPGAIAIQSGIKAACMRAALAAGPAQPLGGGEK